MKIHMLACVFVAATSIGCAPKPSDHYDVYLSDQLSPTMMEEAMNAFSLWEKAVPVHFNIQVAHEAKCEQDCIVVVPASQAEIDKVSGHNCLGVTEYWTNQSVAKIYLDDQISDVNTRLSATAHEIGHAQSLVHTGAGSLMFPGSGPGQSSAITCIDQQQWYSVRGMRHFCVPDVNVALHPGG